MKVLDLQCALGHTFEGWFASEQDFLEQCARALVQCPMCSSASISKKLSAPRLNLLSATRQESSSACEPSDTPTAAPDMPVVSGSTALTNAWLALARHVVANTTDVGDQFANEARKMHYGDAEEKAIRGKTTPEEARALVEEGIEVVPFALTEALKEPLH